MTNELADLIWGIHENNKAQSAVFTIWLTEVIDKPSFYTLTYVDTQALYERPFLLVDSATIKVTVSSEDLLQFIDSCTAKGITLNIEHKKSV
jgi:hypothetical protein